MDNLSEKILKSRELKYMEMQFLKRSFNAVISVKSNFPGPNKKSIYSYILVEHFIKLIPNKFIGKVSFHDGWDGPYYLVGSNIKPEVIKKLLVEIEESHELGRLIDLDVFDGKKTLSRTKMRKCFICNDYAYKCIRLKKHSSEELLDYISTNVITYLKMYISRLIEESILQELDLHPKFGLVTPLTNGSHVDMNYSLMLKAKDSIIPYFIKMFEVGFSNRSIEDVFSLVRQIGLDAEITMLEVTKNVNAYKGLIFNLGIVVSAYAYCLYNHFNIRMIFDIIKEMTKSILNDFNNENSSYGFSAYKTYNILGARGEMSKGIPNVVKAIDNYLKDFSEESRLRTLMFLISRIDDTVLLKRSKDYKDYLYTKKLFKKNLYGDRESILKLNTYCLKRNLSFGGSADLLVLAIFLKKLI